MRLGYQPDDIRSQISVLLSRMQEDAEEESEEEESLEERDIKGRDPKLAAQKVQKCAGRAEGEGQSDSRTHAKGLSLRRYQTGFRRDFRRGIIIINFGKEEIMAVKVGMVSLGCSKNQVDAEILLALMVNNGYELCADPEQCDVVIINTCGFIEDAKKESIETIFEFAQLKAQGKVKVLVITGCLAERYREELAMEIPEADVVLGIGKNTEIAKAVKEALDGRACHRIW